MDRFWKIFITLAVLVSSSAIVLFSFFDPADYFDRPLNEAGYVWHPGDSDYLEIDSQYSNAIKQAKKLRKLLVDGDYLTLEAEIEQAHKKGVTPWYLDSWMAFYFRYLRDNPQETNNTTDVFYAKSWIGKLPNSYIAYGYLGLLYSDLGWAARGRKFKSETPEENFSEMKRYFNLARAELEKSLDKNPENIYAYLLLIEISKSTCHMEGLNKNFKQAIKYTRENIYLYFAYLNSLQPKWCGTNSEMFDFARRYSSTEDSDPALSMLIVKAHENRADQFARKKSKYSWIKKILKIEEPGYWTKYYRYFRADDIWIEYSNAYNSVFEVYPNFSDGLFVYARVANRSGRIQTSLKYFDQSLRSDPKYLSRENIYWIAGRFNDANHPVQARKVYQLYLSLTPDNENQQWAAYAADFVGRQFAREHKYKESFPYLKLVADLTPNYAPAVANYCNAFFSIGDYEEGVKQCNRAIQLDPEYDWSYRVLHQIYERLGDKQKSNNYLQKYESLSH